MGVGRIDDAIFIAHAMTRQLADRTGEFDAGRPSADNDERHPGVTLVFIDGVFCLFKSP